MRVAVALVVVAACSSSSSKPGDSVSFHRDYARDGTWRYAYHQTMKMSAEQQATDLESAGTMTLVSNKDKTATLSIDAKLTIKRAGEPDQTQDAPPMQMTLTEDGTGSQQDDSSMALIGLLFPVPKKPMKVGDTETTTITIPARGLAGKPAVSGPMTMKLVGFQTVGAIRCAQLESTLRVAEKSGDDSVEVNVDGKYCLDPKDASLVTSTVTIDMTLGTKQPGVPSTMKLGGTLTLERK